MTERLLPDLSGFGISNEDAGRHIAKCDKCQRAFDSLIGENQTRNALRLRSFATDLVACLKDERDRPR